MQLALQESKNDFIIAKLNKMNKKCCTKSISHVNFSMKIPMEYKFHLFRIELFKPVSGIAFISLSHCFKCSLSLISVHPELLSRLGARCSRVRFVSQSYLELQPGHLLGPWSATDAL